MSLVLSATQTAQSTGTISPWLIFAFGLVIGWILYRNYEKTVCGDCNSDFVGEHCADCGSSSKKIIETTAWDEFKKIVGRTASDEQKDYPKTVDNE